MNMFPLIGFYMKHQQDLKVLSQHSGPAVDLLKALVPVIKKHWPQANVNNMLDDFVAALDQTTAGDATHMPGYPDPTQQ